MKKAKVKTTKKRKQEDFFDRVYKVVAKIPYGKITTFGDIAEVCGLGCCKNSWMGAEWH